MLSWLTRSSSHVVSEPMDDAAASDGDDATRKRAASPPPPPSSSSASSKRPRGSGLEPTGSDDAPMPTTSLQATEEALLQRLKAELEIKEPLSYIAAARDMLLSPQASFHSLREVHDLPHSRTAFTSVVSILKRLALHEPPACAVRREDPKDVAMLTNLQMLLQTSTANGGASSRSVLHTNTIAVAVELHRDPTLNFFASCIRHGIKMADYGKESPATLDRIASTRDRIVELRLLDFLDEHTRKPADGDGGGGGFLPPIDKAMVGRVRGACNVSIADAARAVAACPDDFAAACAHVRSALGMAPAAADAAAGGSGAICDVDEGLLRRLQPLLRQRSVAPALKTIRVAVQLCRDADLDLGAACLAAGINQDGAVARRRVEGVAARIREMGLLEQLGEQPGGGGGGGGTGTAAVGAAHGPAAGDDVPGGRKSARRAASSSSSARAACACSGSATARASATRTTSSTGSRPRPRRACRSSCSASTSARRSCHTVRLFYGTTLLCRTRLCRCS